MSAAMSAAMSTPSMGAMPMNASMMPMNASTMSPYGDLSKLPHDSKQADIIASSVICWVIAAAFVAARFYTKIIINRASPSGSEWCLLASCLASLGVSIPQIIEAKFGMGAHIWDLNASNSNLVGATECQWISIIFYALSLGLTKVSILLLYITIFYHSWIRMVSYSILTVVVLSNVWVAYVIFSACTPLEAFWDTTIMPAVCHPMAFWLSNQYLFITTDFLIFLLPIPVVWALKVRMGQKMLLVFLFTMGFFACLISVIRIVLATPTLANGGIDISYAPIAIYHWTVVEVNLAIVVACAMTLKPLINRLLPRLGTSSHPYKEQASTTAVCPKIAARMYGANARLGRPGSSASTAASMSQSHIRVDSTFTAHVEEKNDEEIAILDPTVIRWQQQQEQQEISAEAQYASSKPSLSSLDTLKP